MEVRNGGTAGLGVLGRRWEYIHGRTCEQNGSEICWRMFALCHMLTCYANLYLAVATNGKSKEQTRRNSQDSWSMNVEAATYRTL